MIADQRIKDHIIEQAQDLRRTADQLKTLRQIRTSLILVLHFRHNAQRLTKVLLIKIKLTT